MTNDVDKDKPKRLEDPHFPLPKRTAAERKFEEAVVAIAERNTQPRFSGAFVAVLLAASVTVITAGLSFKSEVKSSFNQLNAEVSNNEQSIQRVENNLKSAVTTFKKGHDEIKEKLDEVAERGIRNEEARNREG